MKKVLIVGSALAASLAVVVVLTYASGPTPVKPMTWVYDYDLKPGTQAMAELIEKIQVERQQRQRSLRDPGVIRSLVRTFYQSDASKLRLGELVLQEGEWEQAIELGKVVLSGQEEGSREYLRALELIAIGHLRKGEQENCIAGHNANSCLLPIRGSGVYEVQEDTRQAIEAYESLLGLRPKDWRYRWLLNLAYQTLGEYPESVPGEWLIQSPLLEDKDPSDNFKDIAPKLGLSGLSRAGGAVMEDFNGDGFMDMAFSDMYYQSIQLYVNDGKGGFVNKTKEAGLEGHSAVFNMEQLDYNNDGNLDLFCVRGSWQRVVGMYPNSLLRNNGDGTFTDVTVEAGLLSFKPTSGAVCADFNNDGRVDIFVGNESTPGSEIEFRSELFLNNGDGTFDEAARSAGLDCLAVAKGQAAGDYNNDGLMDLFVSSYRGDNLLFKNLGNDDAGVPQFDSVGEEAGVSGIQDSFTSWFWDYNNDGNLDLFVSEHQLGRGKTAGDAAEFYAEGKSDQVETGFYRNNGDGTFTNVRTEVGLIMPLHAMGANFGDIDNDGYPDFYIGTGEPDYMGVHPNRMLRNHNGSFFEDVSSERGVAHIQKGHGIAFGDLDNDGDQDLLLEAGGTVVGDPFQNSVFENPGNENSWVTLKLEGTKSSRDALGARVKVVVKDGSQNRDIHARVSSGGNFGSNSLQLEIGLGYATEVDTLTIDWPCSAEPQVFRNVTVNRRYHVVEGEVALNAMESPVVKFKDAGSDTHHHHH